MNIHSQRFVQLFFYDHDRDLWWLAKKKIVAQAFVFRSKVVRFYCCRSWGVFQQKKKLALLCGTAIKSDEGF
jgi:hypothetical protein